MIEPRKKRHDAFGVIDEGPTWVLIDKLADRRRHQGLSQDQIAKACYVDQATISRLENHQIPHPTWAVLAAYARAVGTAINSLGEIVDEGAGAMSIDWSSERLRISSAEKHELFLAVQERIARLQREPDSDQRSASLYVLLNMLNRLVG